MVFWDPMTRFSPAFSVGDQTAESIRLDGPAPMNLRHAHRHGPPPVDL